MSWTDSPYLVNHDPEIFSVRASGLPSRTNSWHPLWCSLLSSLPGLMAFFIYSVHCSHFQDKLHTPKPLSATLLWGEGKTGLVANLCSWYRPAILVLWWWLPWLLTTEIVETSSSSREDAFISWWCLPKAGQWQQQAGCLLPPELHGLLENVGQVRKKIRVPEQDGGAGVPPSQGSVRERETGILNLPLHWPVKWSLGALLTKSLSTACSKVGDYK